MTVLQEEINRWKDEYALCSCIDDYKKLLVSMHHIDESEDVSIIERIILLLNQCVVIDRIGDDNIEIDNVDYSRNSLLEQVQVYYEEYVSSSLINEFDCEESIAFKEQIAYLIALLLYKVHRYQDSLLYFKESRIYSKRLSNTNISNGLNLKRRIQRDIYYAYSCEYIGTPQSDRGYLVKAIQLLIGANETDDPEKYWTSFKDFCFDELYDAGVWSSKRNKEEITHEVLKRFVSFSPDDNCALSRLLNDQNLYKEEYEKEYKEAVHVLAHCLNEVNALTTRTITERETANFALEVPKITDSEANDMLSKRNFINFLSRLLIDSLGEKFATCQATIRAEQGVGVDAISVLNKHDKTSLKETDLAELDFYKFYFNTMFFPNPDIVADKTKNGELFYEYCENKADLDNKRDGLLHYHVISLRNELRQYIEIILNAKNRNELFLLEEKAIGKSTCFLHYEFLRKNQFTIYENSQIVQERERLICVYRVIRTLQNLKLPLFFDATASFDEKLDIKDAIEELFELCHKVNYCDGSNEQLGFYQYKRCFCCKKQEYCGFSIQNTNGSVKEYHADTERTSAACEINTDGKNVFSTVLVDNTLKFDVHGDLERLTRYLSSKKVDFKVVQKDKALSARNQSKHKMVLGSDWSDRCAELYQKLNGYYFHIFYVYSTDGEEPDCENFNNAPIAAFPSVDLCFLFAYIYASVDRIINSILSPKPIFILAPLRNASSYAFQDAEFSSLVDCPESFDSKVVISRGGIGIDGNTRTKMSSERKYNLSFSSKEVEESCVDVIKFVNDQLYVFRDGVLVHKTRVNIELIKNYFLEYSNARKKSLPKFHNLCKENSTRCCCVYCEINDMAGEKTLSVKNLNAGTKLLRFLRLACEEDVAWSAPLFLLEKSYTTLDPATEYNNSKKLEFELFIFYKDINSCVGHECLKNIAIVTEASNKNDEAAVPSKESNNIQCDEKNYSDDYIASWRSELYDTRRCIELGMERAKLKNIKAQLAELFNISIELEKELNVTKDYESWRQKYSDFDQKAKNVLKGCL